MDVSDPVERLRPIELWSQLSETSEKSGDYLGACDLDADKIIGVVQNAPAWSSSRLPSAGQEAVLQLAVLMMSPNGTERTSCDVRDLVAMSAKAEVLYRPGDFAF
jgi:hypothetical protein